MWWWIIAAVAGAVVVAVFWDEIRDLVASWLREHGLSKSILMDGWVRLDNVVGGVRRRLFLKRRDRKRATKIEECVMPRDAVDDADVRAELEARGAVKRSIMAQIQ